ncbi:hypothetical protein BGZ83_006894 [Gryganskiella cystojenkinii]|nr:hypothetical protein BGZ83_006894 [Gryganskiella cystojenkinii]
MSSLTSPQGQAFVTTPTSALFQGGTVDFGMHSHQKQGQQHQLQQQPYTSLSWCSLENEGLDRQEFGDPNFHQPEHYLPQQQHEETPRIQMFAQADMVPTSSPTTNIPGNVIPLSQKPQHHSHQLHHHAHQFHHHHLSGDPLFSQRSNHSLLTSDPHNESPDPLLYRAPPIPSFSSSPSISAPITTTIRTVAPMESLSSSSAVSPRSESSSPPLARRLRSSNNNKNDKEQSNYSNRKRPSTQNQVETYNNQDLGPHRGSISSGFSSSSSTTTPKTVVTSVPLITPSIKGKAPQRRATLTTATPTSHRGAVVNIGGTLYRGNQNLGAVEPYQYSNIGTRQDVEDSDKTDDDGEDDEQVQYPFMPCASQIPRRRRLTVDETEYLLEQFQKVDKPNAKDRLKFAKDLNLSPRTIQIWFQNRRAKLKKDQRLARDLYATVQEDEDESEKEQREGGGADEKGVGGQTFSEVSDDTDSGDDQMPSNEGQKVEHTNPGGHQGRQDHDHTQHESQGAQQHGYRQGPVLSIGSNYSMVDFNHLEPSGTWFDSNTSSMHINDHAQNLGSSSTSDGDLARGQDSFLGNSNNTSLMMWDHPHLAMTLGARNSNVIHNHTNVGLDSTLLPMAIAPSQFSAIPTTESHMREHYLSMSHLTSFQNLRSSTFPTSSSVLVPQYQVQRHHSESTIPLLLPRGQDRLYGQRQPPQSGAGAVSSALSASPVDLLMQSPPPQSQQRHDTTASLPVQARSLSRKKFNQNPVPRHQRALTLVIDGNEESNTRESTS